MPAPSSSLATLRPDLDAGFLEFDTAMDRAGFVGHRLLPPFEVQLVSGNFGRIPIEQLLQTRDTARAARAGYARGNWDFTQDSYTTREHGAEEPIDDNEAAIYAAYFDVEQVSAERARDAVLRNAEIRIVAAVLNSAVWTGAALTTAVGTAWDDLDDADPIADVDAARRLIWDGSGIWPNAIVMSYKKFLDLRRVESVLDKIMSLGAGDRALPKDITRAHIAAAFDVEEVIVAGSAKNTANEGQSVSIAEIWDDDQALLCRVARTNDLREPCLGRTMHYAGDGSQIGGTSETYRDETIRGDVVRVRHQVGEKIMYTEAAHRITGLTT